MFIMLLFISFISCKSLYQEIIDLTKKSSLSFKELSDDYMSNEDNHIKMPGIYTETNVCYQINMPTFATDSIIVNGIYIKDGLLGIIPSNIKDFNKISKSFCIIDRKSKIFYRVEQLLEKSDDVYIFSIINVSSSSVLKIISVDLTTEPIEKDFPDFGLNLRFEIKHEKSTDSNIFYISAGFCYDLKAKDKYSLKNVKKFDWPFINKSQKNIWTLLLDHFLIGMRLDFEIKMTGILDGTFNVKTNFIGGVGFIVEFEKLIKEISDKYRLDIFTYPYTPTIKAFGMKLDLECGFKFSTFLEAIKVTLPVIRVLGGLQVTSEFSMDFDYKNTKKNGVIYNFRMNDFTPKLVFEYPSLKELIEKISVSFTLTPSIIPFFVKIDFLDTKADVELRLDIPYTYTYRGNTNCTKLIEFELDFQMKLVIDYDIDIILFPPKKDSIPFELTNSLQMAKICIDRYTDEYIEIEIENAHERDKFNYNPDKPEDPVIPFQYFKFSTQELAGKSYTATFTEPYKDGTLDVQIGVAEKSIKNRLIFSIKNGYVLPEFATKLDGEDIYIMKVSSAMYNSTDHNYFLPIKFKRYKQQNVVFHFYNIYSLYENNGDYMCPKSFPVKDSVVLLNNIGCIGTQSTPSMVQCCNDCTFNFCFDPVSREKLGDKYFILNMFSDYIWHTNGNPYWVPEYHTFPTNVESFEIPADEFMYVPRVKCERCDSVQFIIDDKVYPSKRWGKTDLFSPNIPINGYDYDPDIDIDDAFSTDFEINTLPGITNQNIKVISICNSNEKSYCYSKCIEPKGVSIIEMKDQSGIHIYSGDISKAVPNNIYEKNSQYQVVNYDEIPKNVYCSKSWEGKINYVENIKKGKVTLSIVNSSDGTKTIKAYLGNNYIPFSKTKLYLNILAFFVNMGISIEENSVLLEGSNENSEIFYALINFDGSIQVNSKYFNESKINFGENVVNVPYSYVSSVDIIHTEFVPENKNNNSKVIIIVCCVVAAVILIAIVIITVYCIKKKKREQAANGSSENENN